MKADFLFVGLTLNTIVQQKTPETWTFHALKIFKCLNTIVPFPPIKISDYAPGCHCWYLPKDVVWFVVCSSAH